MSSENLYWGYPSPATVDNNFDTYAHTNNSEVPWINIQLSESAIIRSVLVIMDPFCCFNRMGIASITAGNNSHPNLNPVCKANID
jgi:hypothetical protein